MKRLGNESHQAQWFRVVIKVLSNWHRKTLPETSILIYKLDISREGVVRSLYVTHISQGYSSKVFEVDARWSWARQDASQSDELRDLKVAVKRLSRHTESGQILQEYDASPELIIAVSLDF